MNLEYLLVFFHQILGHYAEANDHATVAVRLHLQMDERVSFPNTLIVQFSNKNFSPEATNSTSSHASSQWIMEMNLSLPHDNDAKWKRT